MIFFIYLFILQKKKQECEIRAHSNFMQTDGEKPIIALFQIFHMHFLTQ